MQQLLQILEQALSGKFPNLNPAQLLVLGARLTAVLPDLALDGDPHLTSEHRLEILDIVADFESEVLS